MENTTLELYAEELPDITQYTAAGTSTLSTESSVLSASCPTSTVSTYTSMSSYSW
ncbi:thiocillin family RiPP [Geobacillus icigianus]|nr:MULTISPECIES: thiocillin family RiPP [Geobacillus]